MRSKIKIVILKWWFSIYIFVEVLLKALTEGLVVISSGNLLHIFKPDTKWFWVVLAERHFLYCVESLVDINITKNVVVLAEALIGGGRGGHIPALFSLGDSIGNVPHFFSLKNKFTYKFIYK